jgi:pimeloyl-ACP methyl ester carboxylesterase
MSTFLLIHGGGHGGWCWEHVVPMLVAQGHRALTPDLPGFGADQTPPDEVSIDLWARSIVDVLQSQPEPVILVGHSQGGLAISQAAEYAREYITALVYLTAFLPRDGETATDIWNSLRFDDGECLIEIAVSSDGKYLDYDGTSARAALYGETPTALASKALTRLMPTPAAAFNDPIHLSASRYGTVPRFFIECIRDRAIPLRLQRAMHTASPCRAVYAIDTDHSPFLSTPGELVNILLTVASIRG